MRYNKPEFEIDNSALDKYSVISVIYPGYKTGIFEALDSAKIEEGIVSLYCERYDPVSKSQTSYLLVKKERSHQIRTKLMEEVGKEAAIYEVKPSAMDHNSLINLLIRSIPYFSFGNAGSSNAAGYLFYYVSQKMDDPEQFNAVSVHYTQCGALDLSLKTFSSEAIKEKIGGDKRWNKKAKFLLQGTRIKRAPSDTDETRYIIAQKDNTKSSMDYFQKDYNGYLHSKSHVMESLIHDLEMVPFIRISSWSDLPDIDQIRLRSTAFSVKDLMKRLNELMPKIRIQNETDPDTEEKLKDALLECGYTGIITDEDAPAIRILEHDAEYYRITGSEDPYEKSEDSVQHLTRDSMKAKKMRIDDDGKKIEIVKYSFDKAVIRNCLINLYIKQEIKDGKLNLFSWDTKIGAKTDVYMMYEDEPYGMMIGADGRFICKKIDDDETLELLMGLFDDDVDLIIYDGLWYLISDTGYTAIADRIEDMKRRIAEAGDAPKRQKGWKKNKDGELEPRMISTDGISNKKTREEYLDSLIDIHYAMQGDDMWYSVGLPGDGLKSIAHATHIRKVRCWNGDEYIPADRFAKYICAMDVAFVGNGKPTVFPFMKKHLLEFCRMQN